MDFTLAAPLRLDRENGVYFLELFREGIRYRCEFNTAEVDALFGDDPTPQHVGEVKAKLAVHAMDACRTRTGHEQHQVVQMSLAMYFPPEEA